MTPEGSLAFDPQLASTPSNLTINHFFRQYAEGVLILRPPFQRNLVWNTEQQGFLVDSILRGLPVPEVYIQTETSADGSESTIVVDGQQRISACLNFIEGKIRLGGGEELGDEWRGKTFSELEEGLQRRFRSYELVARKLPSVGDNVLREIFRRLNKTVEAMEPQELRHAAYTGPFVKLIELASQNSLFSDLGLFSPKDYLRRRSDEFVAEISYAVISGAYPNKKDGLDELFLAYEKQGVPAGVIEDLERRFGRVISTLSPIASQMRRTRFRNKSDFYTLFVLLAKKAEHLPVSSEALLDILQDFSERVNTIKRGEGGSEASTGMSEVQKDQAASAYLRSVERAASDRLSRVRREEALDRVLSGVVQEGAESALSSSDAYWVLEGSGSESEDMQNESEERDHVREVLLGE
ncbi:DUF262 domain-containing protein [Nocardiopsis metallicus]|uniref:GmrSD restriction endonucleases N-terminal domain-containing protein n=1 Tax=Nocardiopsis metallicus TaxID=179819 RepID=A0A840WFN0_9ACTN|nr:DUF262 domain-containing protein [Nocardiopsis metallicus]MBB5494223.1 hypothetical protein [Nocardiopsis metallicus]